MDLPSDINPGIRKTVEWLNGHGFRTTDSGDGETHMAECDRPYPYVSIILDSPDDIVPEVDRLAGLLAEMGVAVGALDEHGNGPYIQGMYAYGAGPAMIDMINISDKTLFGAEA
jgi:hypothetical protein